MSKDFLDCAWRDLCGLVIKRIPPKEDSQKKFPTSLLSPLRFFFFSNIFLLLFFFFALVELIDSCLLNSFPFFFNVLVETLWYAGTCQLRVRVIADPVYYTQYSI